MPYSIEKSGDEWLIKKDDGTVVGRSKTQADAEASVRARLRGEHMKEARWDSYLNKFVDGPM